MNTASIVSLVVMLLTALASAFVGPVSAFWTAHPDIAIAVASLWGAIAHFLPSPTAAKQ